MIRRLCAAIKNEYENTIFGYLKVIASNVVRDHFRQPENKADEIELSDAVLPPGPQDRERLEFLHKKEEIKGILETLSASETYQRDVAIFWLFYEQGYTAKEISLLPHRADGKRGGGRIVSPGPPCSRKTWARRSPRRAIELQYFHRVREDKRFRAGCYVFRDRRGSTRDQMKENAKREMLDAEAPFVRRIGNARAELCWSCRDGG